MTASSATSGPRLRPSPRRRDPAPDIDRSHEAALDKASDAAGAYLDGLGRFDLERLKPEEWRAMLEAAIDAYAEHPDCPYAIPL